MATRDQYYELLDLIARLNARVADLQASELPRDAVMAATVANRMEDFEDRLLEVKTEQEPPPDGGMARLVGIGPHAADEIGEIRVGSDIQQFDETVVSERLQAVGDLYYQYQYETALVFRGVLQLQELFNSGQVRLSSGPGALALYQYDRKRVLHHSQRERLQAYKRVFGYTDASPAPGAKSNAGFHRLFTRFNIEVARYFRDKRISEVIRPDNRDLTFGSIATVRRAGLDLRANLKQTSYGHVNVLVLEISQLLEAAVAILGAEDVKQLFGAEDAWQVLGDILKRHLGLESFASQRSRMATAGKEIIHWLAQPHILTTNQTEFDYLVTNIANDAEEWLVSAESLGLGGKIPHKSGTVIPMRKRTRSLKSA